MKMIQCEQRGAEWFDARRGIPTASRFCEFITGTGKASAAASKRAYALELVYERLTHRPFEHFVSKAAERGITLEPTARAWYQVNTGRQVTETGICLADDGSCGCSPDGLCEDRGIEIKCPMPAEFMNVAASRAIPADHVLQMQVGMWITGLPRWDYILFTDVPGLEPQIIESVANPETHKAFAEIVPAFCEYVSILENAMRASGHGKIPEATPMPSWDDITGGETIP